MSKSARFTVEFDTMAKPEKTVESDLQSDVYIDAARDLYSEESEEGFDTAQISSKPPLRRLIGDKNKEADGDAHK